jgi:hypothetical protein
MKLNQMKLKYSSFGTTGKTPLFYKTYENDVFELKKQSIQSTIMEPGSESCPVFLWVIGRSVS